MVASKRILKHTSGKHKINTIPHIPTKKGWIGLLKNAGFEVKTILTDVSKVNIRDWVGQVSEKDLSKISGFHSSAPEKARKKFQITKNKDGTTNINYPYVLIQAKKPK